MPNLLSNGSFEAGWTDDGNRQVPVGFTFNYVEGRVEPEYDSGEDWCVYVPPEMRHLLKTDVPESERDLFWWQGDTTLKIFKDSGAWKGRLLQLRDLKAGHYRLELGVYPDAVSSYKGGKQAAIDPASAQIRSVLVQGDYVIDGLWVPMTPFLERQTRWFDFIVEAGLAQIGVEWRFPFALANSGLFTDGWSLSMGEEPPPKPEGPRVDYKRHYIVLPDYCTLEQAQQVMADTWDDRPTIGGSYDDAGYGPGLSDITAELRGVKVEEKKADFEAFYTEYYPSAKRIYKPLPGEGQTPTGKRPNISGWVGVHQLASQPDGFVELQNTGPSVYKAVNRIDQIIAAWQATPSDSDALFVFRKHHHEEGGPAFRYNPDKRAAAENWGALQLPDLTTELGRAGMPTEQVFVQSLNEVWEYDRALNRHAWQFDLEWLLVLDKWNREHGTHFRATASTMAVGNPATPEEDEAQWLELIPWACALRDAGAVAVYHNYGLCVPEHPEYLAVYAEWLQDRWVKYYDWLKAHGVILPWFFGEGFLVGGSVVDASNKIVANAIHRVALAKDYYTIKVGNEIITLEKRKTLMSPPGQASARMWLNPGQGWKGLISVDRAVSELMQYWNDRLEVINKERGYKAHIGGTPFQGGNDSDWDRFNLAGEPYRKIAEVYRSV